MNKISVNYSKTTEAKRIAHTLYGVLTGFYITNKWYVFSSKIAKSKMQSVVLLPRLNYSKIQNTINAKKLKEKRGVKADDSGIFVKDKKIISFIEKELEKSGQFSAMSDKQLNEFETKCRQILVPAIKKTKLLIPLLANSNFNITVKPSNFGVYLSFDKIEYDKDINNIDISITLRNDQDPQYILEGLASSISRQLVELYSNWRETEAVSDFFTKYVFGFSEFKGTLEAVNKIDYKLLNKSVDYLLSINAPTGLPLEYNLARNLITFYGKDITPILSPYEFRVLKVLIINRNKTVTFDQISDYIYKENVDLKFTLWGITKTIQRVRDKLEELGVPRSVIQNVKGEGFKLLG